MRISYAILPVLVALACLTAQAKVIAPPQALQRAQTLLAQDMGSHLSTASLADARLAYTMYDGRLPSLYAFNARRGGGWLMCPADDGAAPLLAFNNTGQWYQRSTPPALQALMLDYQAEIRRARVAQKASHEADAYERPRRQAIPPMCQSAWNQGNPYNLLTPVVGGRRCVTGCAATAMAQIMYYHRWPLQPSGRLMNVNGRDTLYLDLGAKPFEWNLMLPQYADSLYSPEQAQAVAYLMEACGYSLVTRYGPANSVANTWQGVKAYPRYFGYDPSIRYVERQYYSLLDWEQLIYNNLAQYGPVNFRGASADTGHSFVCDGVAMSCMFHINWGWGGRSDGYFRLSALEPKDQGIGGGSGGYSSHDGALVNISPFHGGSAYSGLASSKPLTATCADGTLTLGGYIGNDGAAPFTGRVYIDATDDKGRVYPLKKMTVTDLKPGTGWSALTVSDLPARRLPNGVYRLRLYYSYGDDRYRIPVPTLNTQAPYVVLTVRQDTYGAVVPLRYDTYVRDVEWHGEPSSGKPFTMTPILTSASPSEEAIQLTPAIYSALGAHRRLRALKAFSADVLPGDNYVTYRGTMPSRRQLVPGEYLMAFEYRVGSPGKGTAQMARVSPFFPFTIK